MYIVLWTHQVYEVQPDSCSNRAVKATELYVLVVTYMRTFEGM